MPLCCINEPLNFNANHNDEKLKNKDAPPEKTINNLKIRIAGKINDTALNISNLTKVKDLKAKIAKSEKVKAANIRLFCLGKELKDDLFLYSYDMVDELTVQAMIKK